MFLDFLERLEQDLQLSCWKNFDLKLAWTCNFEENDFPFWAGENYRSLPFWETFCLTSNPSILIFEMLDEACIYMNEAFPTISHLQIPD